MTHDGTPVRGTGNAGLDRLLGSVLPGDNIVWQVDSTEEYIPFASAFLEESNREGKRLIYFRFARHAPLFLPGQGAEIHVLSPEVGFETFTAEIHRVIEEAGRGTGYVFDCLSDLAADWYSDLMLANFFMVTCPYLYELETVTYFALYRDCHSLDAVAAIRGTTQVLLDTFRHEGRLYLHPLKVDGRHSPTMYLPHVLEDSGSFRPLTESAILSDVLARISSLRVDTVSRTLDMWDRKFLQAREVLDGVLSGVLHPAEGEEIFRRLLRMMVSRDERVVALAERYFDLTDLLEIRKRMIGTGLVGGKTVGMLLSRAILRRTDPAWEERLETHDSFYIGADVFYTYLVRNGCWHARRGQRMRDSFLEGSPEARERILSGYFPEFLREQFIAMLEYFGQSPIIVRSSSILEDSFGNAFTGKYDSVFCPNQGSPEERLAAFLFAVKKVYASTMSEDALLYRSHRGLLERDEQMALLVQRVSGAVNGSYFYPQAAGVALSYNPYAWSEQIDPHAGVVRLVFGLGTRAVDRSDDDYTRIVALNDPLRRPDSTVEGAVEYAQRRVDVLDLARNRFGSHSIDEVAREAPDVPMHMFAVRRGEMMRSRGGAVREEGGPWVLTFEKLLSSSPFTGYVREMLAVLREAYDYPVDVEFTANFLSDGTFRLNPVQCRPLQVKEGGVIVPLPTDTDPADRLFEAAGPIIGQSSLSSLDRLVYVVPDRYAGLTQTQRYSVARLIGRILREGAEEAPGRKVLLAGPGRWGTSTPSLGVPVSFSEINTAAVLCEVVAMGGGVVPDVSLGSHFFNDLVEANMLYLALFPGKEGHVFNEALVLSRENRLPALSPEDAGLSEVVRVVDFPGPDGRVLRVGADTPKQHALAYLATPEE
jgi:hypothetical protein